MCIHTHKYTHTGTHTSICNKRILGGIYYCFENSGMRIMFTAFPKVAVLHSPLGSMILAYIATSDVMRTIPQGGSF